MATQQVDKACFHSQAATMAHTEKSVVKEEDGLRAPRIPKKVSMTNILSR
jgi:hypothetical protein